MSEEVPTKIVKEKETNRLRRINVSSFDPEKHEEITSVQTEKKTGRQPSNKKEQAPAAKFSIEPKDDKFLIVNEKGEQQGEAFDNEEDAQTMLKIMGV